jgi:hypothetical protein
MVRAKTNGLPNTIFNFQCPGNSSHYQKMLLKEGKANREIAMVCNDRFVRVAFNQDPGFFEVYHETNSMVEYTIEGGEGAWEWEILSSFFANRRLTPIFINCNFTWGWLDEDTGVLNGAVAKVALLSFIFPFC